MGSPQENQSRVVLVRDRSAVDDAHKINTNIVANMIDAAVKALVETDDSRDAWRYFVKADDHVGIKYTKCSWMRVHTDMSLVDSIKSRLLDIGLTKDKIEAKDAGMNVKTCSALINVPSVKVHSLTGIAASIKNYINFVSNPSDYHLDLSGKLGEIWQRAEIKDKTRLIIVDALRPYFGPGPQIDPRHRWDYKGILAGTDPVALDTVCLEICQKKRNLFRNEEWTIAPPPIHIKEADTKYHLGTSDRSRINLTKLGWEQDLLI